MASVDQQSVLGEWQSLYDEFLNAERAMETAEQALVPPDPLATPPPEPSMTDLAFPTGRQQTMLSVPSGSWLSREAFPGDIIDAVVDESLTEDAVAVEEELLRRLVDRSREDDMSSQRMPHLPSFGHHHHRVGGTSPRAAASTNATQAWAPMHPRNLPHPQPNIALPGTLPVSQQTPHPTGHTSAAARSAVARDPSSRASTPAAALSPSHRSCSPDCQTAHQDRPAAVRSSAPLADSSPPHPLGQQPTSGRSFRQQPEPAFALRHTLAMRTSPGRASAPSPPRSGRDLSPGHSGSRPSSSRHHTTSSYAALHSQRQGSPPQQVPTAPREELFEALHRGFSPHRLRLLIAAKAFASGRNIHTSHEAPTRHQAQQPQRHQQQDTQPQVQQQMQAPYKPRTPQVGASRQRSHDPSDSGRRAPQTDPRPADVVRRAASGSFAPPFMAPLSGPGQPSHPSLSASRRNLLQSLLQDDRLVGRSSRRQDGGGRPAANMSLRASAPARSTGGVDATPDANTNTAAGKAAPTWDADESQPCGHAAVAHGGGGASRVPGPMPHDAACTVDSCAASSEVRGRMVERWENDAVPQRGPSLGSAARKPPRSPVLHVSSTSEVHSPDLYISPKAYRDYAATATGVKLPLGSGPGSTAAAADAGLDQRGVRAMQKRLAAEMETAAEGLRAAVQPGAPALPKGKQAVARARAGASPRRLEADPSDDGRAPPYDLAPDTHAATSFLDEAPSFTSSWGMSAPQPNPCGPAADGPRGFPRTRAQDLELDPPKFELLEDSEFEYYESLAAAQSGGGRSGGVQPPPRPASATWEAGSPGAATARVSWPAPGHALQERVHAWQEGRSGSGVPLYDTRLAAAGMEPASLSPSAPRGAWRSPADGSGELRQPDPSSTSPRLHCGDSRSFEHQEALLCEPTLAPGHLQELLGDHNRGSSRVLGGHISGSMEEEGGMSAAALSAAAAAVMANAISSARHEGNATSEEGVVVGLGAAAAALEGRPFSLRTAPAGLDVGVLKGQLRNMDVTHLELIRGYASGYIDGRVQALPQQGQIRSQVVKAAVLQLVDEALNAKRAAVAAAAAEAAAAAANEAVAEVAAAISNIGAPASSLQVPPALPPGAVARRSRKMSLASFHEELVARIRAVAADVVEDTDEESQDHDSKLRQPDPAHDFAAPAPATGLAFAPRSSGCTAQQEVVPAAAAVLTGRSSDNGSVRSGRALSAGGLATGRRRGLRKRVSWQSDQGSPPDGMAASAGADSEDEALAALMVAVPATQPRAASSDVSRTGTGRHTGTPPPLPPKPGSVHSVYPSNACSGSGGGGHNSATAAAAGVEGACMTDPVGGCANRNAQWVAESPGGGQEEKASPGPLAVDAAAPAVASVYPTGSLEPMQATEGQQPECRGERPLPALEMTKTSGAGTAKPGPNCMVDSVHMEACVQDGPAVEHVVVQVVRSRGSSSSLAQLIAAQLSDSPVKVEGDCGGGCGGCGDGDGNGGVPVWPPDSSSRRGDCSGSASGAAMEQTPMYEGLMKGQPAVASTLTEDEDQPPPLLPRARGDDRWPLGGHQRSRSSPARATSPRGDQRQAVDGGRSAAEGELSSSAPSRAESTTLTAAEAERQSRANPVAADVAAQPLPQSPMGPSVGSRATASDLRPGNSGPLQPEQATLKGAALESAAPQPDAAGPAVSHTSYAALIAAWEARATAAARASSCPSTSHGPNLPARPYSNALRHVVSSTSPSTSPGMVAKAPTSSTGIKRTTANSNRKAGNSSGGGAATAAGTPPGASHQPCRSQSHSTTPTSPGLTGRITLSKPAGAAFSSPPISPASWRPPKLQALSAAHSSGSRRGTASAAPVPSASVTSPLAAASGGRAAPEPVESGKAASPAVAGACARQPLPPMGAGSAAPAAAAAPDTDDLAQKLRNESLNFILRLEAAMAAEAAAAAAVRAGFAAAVAAGSTGGGVSAAKAAEAKVAAAAAAAEAAAAQARLEAAGVAPVAAVGVPAEASLGAGEGVTYSARSAEVSVTTAEAAVVVAATGAVMVASPEVEATMPAGLESLPHEAKVPIEPRAAVLVVPEPQQQEEDLREAAQEPSLAVVIPTAREEPTREAESPNAGELLVLLPAVQGAQRNAGEPEEPPVVTPGPMAVVSHEDKARGVGLGCANTCDAEDDLPPLPDGDAALAVVVGVYGNSGSDSGRGSGKSVPISAAAAAMSAPVVAPSAPSPPPQPEDSPTSLDSARLPLEPQPHGVTLAPELLLEEPLPAVGPAMLPSWPPSSGSLVCGITATAAADIATGTFLGLSTLQPAVISGDALPNTASGARAMAAAPAPAAPLEGAEEDQELFVAAGLGGAGCPLPPPGYSVSGQAEIAGGQEGGRLEAVGAEAVGPEAFPPQDPAAAATEFIDRPDVESRVSEAVVLQPASASAAAVKVMQAEDGQAQEEQSNAQHSAPTLAAGAEVADPVPELAVDCMPMDFSERPAAADVPNIVVLPQLRRLTADAPGQAPQRSSSAGSLASGSAVVGGKSEKEAGALPGPAGGRLPGADPAAAVAEEQRAAAEVGTSATTEATQQEVPAAAAPMPPLPPVSGPAPPTPADTQRPSVASALVSPSSEVLGPSVTAPSDPSGAAPPPQPQDPDLAPTTTLTTAAAGPGTPITSPVADETIVAAASLAAAAPLAAPIATGDGSLANSSSGDGAQPPLVCSGFREVLPSTLAPASAASPADTPPGSRTVTPSRSRSRETRSIEPVLSELRAVRAAISAGGDPDGSRVTRMSDLLGQLDSYRRSVEKRHGSSHSIATQLRILHTDMSKWLQASLATASSAASSGAAHTPGGDTAAAAHPPPLHSTLSQPQQPEPSQLPPPSSSGELQQQHLVGDVGAAAAAASPPAASSACVGSPLPVSQSEIVPASGPQPALPAAPLPPPPQSPQSRAADTLQQPSPQQHPRQWQPSAGVRESLSSTHTDATFDVAASTATTPHASALGAASDHFAFPHRLLQHQSHQQPASYADPPSEPAFRAASVTNGNGSGIQPLIPLPLSLPEAAASGAAAPGTMTAPSMGMPPVMAAAYAFQAPGAPGVAAAGSGLSSGGGGGYAHGAAQVPAPTRMLVPHGGMQQGLLGTGVATPQGLVVGGMTGAAGPPFMGAAMGVGAGQGQYGGVMGSSPGMSLLELANQLNNMILQQQQPQAATAGAFLSGLRGAIGSQHVTALPGAPVAGSPAVASVPQAMSEGPTAAAGKTSSGVGSAVKSSFLGESAASEVTEPGSTRSVSPGPGSLLNNTGVPTSPKRKARSKWGALFGGKK